MSTEERTCPGMTLPLVAVAAWFSVLVPSPAPAGTIGDDFQDVLLRAQPGTPVVGIAFLQEQLDVRALEAEMERDGLQTRWRRHEKVVREAQALARRTQARLLLELEDRRARGEVLRVQPFWIVNAVAVEASVESFAALATHPDVHAIHANLRLPLRTWDRPGGTDANDGSPGGTSEPDRPASANLVAEDGLRVIHAPEAWARGYTGRGILVGHFDSGAYGQHEAFAARWRGTRADVPWWQAWHDPYTLSEFPYDSQAHGTHVLGIMVAAPPDTDALGVAWEANWIAAGALIDYDVEKILGAFEWAVDPDQDPSTVEDVPCALNHSWGTSDDCSDVYWGALDVAEAAGVANVFAADNSGPAPGSVNSPESRAETPYRNFSAGGLNPHVEELTIRSASGRGPSPCDGVSIKPEVAGPGTSIRSTLPAPVDGPPGGTYGVQSGNSVAAPHVTGALALVFQANRSLTTDLAKEALMATALDLGALGEDNDYGWGLIDVDAALTWVETHHPAHPEPFSIIGPPAPAEVIVLHWNPPRFVPPNRTVMAYRIYRAEGEDPFGEAPLIEVPAFPTSFYDRGLSGEFRYVVTAIYDDGIESEPTPVVRVTVTPSPRGEPDLGFAASVAPNPFRDSAMIRFSLDAPAAVTVTVHDVAGTLIRTLRSGAANAGPQAVRWDGKTREGRRAASGTYFIRLQTPGHARAERLVLLQ